MTSEQVAVGRSQTVRRSEQVPGLGSCALTPKNISPHIDATSEGNKEFEPSSILFCLSSNADRVVSAHGQKRNWRPFEDQKKKKFFPRLA